jgi:hypothetical protein
MQARTPALQDALFLQDTTQKISIFAKSDGILVSEAGVNEFRRPDIQMEECTGPGRYARGPV